MKTIKEERIAQRPKKITSDIDIYFMLEDRSYRFPWTEANPFPETDNTKNKVCTRKRFPSEHNTA